MKNGSAAQPNPVAAASLRSPLNAISLAVEAALLMHANNCAELVPKRYREQCGIEQMALAIQDPWFQPFDRVRASDGLPVVIPRAARCTLLTSTGPVHVLIDLVQNPKLAESVLALGRLLFTHARADKYMVLYKVYEALEPRPDLRYSAVRHALSHHPAILQRPGTVAELMSLFGTTSIDLDLSKHARAFYQRFAELLHVTDRLVASELLRSLPHLRQVAHKSDALHH